MRLTVLGCAGSFPGPDGPASSYLVEHEGFRLVLDMGPGALGTLQSHVGLQDVDAIFVSHLHADHCLDLCSYVVARRYHPQSPLPRVPVHAPTGAHERLRAAYDVDAPVLTDVYDFHDLSERTFELGPFQARTVRVNHPVETYAIRLEAAGRSFVYSGDTGVSESLVDLARHADVLLCEASYTDGPSNPPDLHLTGREAGEHAEKAAVGRLLLTHIPAWTSTRAVLAEAAGSFAGSVETVTTGGMYEI